MIRKDEGYVQIRVGCHTFRHTSAPLRVINEASIYDVQKLLGHRSISMTQVYAHLSENATRRAVDLIDFGLKNVTNSGVKAVDYEPNWPNSMLMILATDVENTGVKPCFIKILAGAK